LSKNPDGEDLRRTIEKLLHEQEKIMEKHKARKRFAVDTPEPPGPKGAERSQEMTPTNAKICQECGQKTLLPAVLGNGVICISCGYVWFKANEMVSRLISRDTQEDDNLELGLIMALKVKG